MFNSILKQKEPILSTLAMLRPDLTFTQDELAILENLCALLEPFREVAEEVSSEKQITLSKLILFSRGLVI